MTALHDQSVQGMSIHLSSFSLGISFENQPSAEEFSSLLFSSVKACVPRDVTSTRSREKMWSSYHQLRCSAAYISRWQCFLKQSLGVEGHPILFQSIGNAVLKKLVKEKCPVSQTAGAEQQPSITTQELNALKICSRLYTKSSLKEAEEVCPSTQRPATVVPVRSTG